MPFDRVLRRFFVATVVWTLAFGASASAADDSQTTTDRQAIEKIVREYLLSNPEILEEAKAELDRRQELARVEAQSAALMQNAQQLTRSESDFVIGNPDGDVTLVEFFDFNCGYCKKAVADVRELATSDSRLRIVLKDFPILSEGSAEAAKVALAAKGQLAADKQFDFHVKLLGTQGMIDGTRALEVAGEMGLDVAKIKTDMNSEAVKMALAANMKLAQTLGLTGTPSFIIGKEVVQGAVGYETLKASVENTRKCKGELTC